MAFLSYNTFTPTNKRKILSDIISMYYQMGFDFSNYVGRPLSFYDFDSIVKTMHKRDSYYKEVTGESFFDESNVDFYLGRIIKKRK